MGQGGHPLFVLHAVKQRQQQKKGTEKDSAYSKVSETCMLNSERRRTQKAIRTNLHVHSSA